MKDKVTIKTNSAISSVSVINDIESFARKKNEDRDKIKQLQKDLAESQKEIEQLRQEMEGFLIAVKSLDLAAEKLNKKCEELVHSHRKELAKLSIDIAEKILQKQIEKGQYDIESIIIDTLNNAPSRREVMVRLNPMDLKAIQSGLSPEGQALLKHVRFESDTLVGRGECVLETDKGIIEYMIDEHVEQIREALGAKSNTEKTADDK